jgi:hypothetical protein
MNLLRLIADVQLSPHTVVMVVCALVGALVLNRYTRIRGVVGFALNLLLLLGGALAADYLSKGIAIPLGYLLERTLVVSFVGMLAASIMLLLLFPRPRTE